MRFCGPLTRLFVLRTNESGRIPRCCPGLLLLPRQASAAGSLVSDIKKWFPQPVLPRHRLVHNKECCCYTMKGVLHEMDPPVGFAPTWSCLRNGCLSTSATEEFDKWCGQPDSHRRLSLGIAASCCWTMTTMNWCGMSVLPRRDGFGRPACCCYINAALKMVAGVGSAPTCAELQPAAHLSKPSSVL